MGKGTLKDLSKAVFWVRQAADQDFRKRNVRAYPVSF